MKLEILKRKAKSKGENNLLRREGNIPAIVYNLGSASEAIALKGPEFLAAMREVQPGRLPTTIFHLMDSGKERRVLVKEIQYHPTTYAILHLDFEEMHENVQINVKVPIECIGVVDCIGVKLGGAIRQVIRYLRVRCLPRDIPESFELDVRTMGLRESRKLSDLQIPQTVRPLMNLNEVAVVIVKR